MSEINKVIEYGTDLHTSILKELVARKNYSKRKMEDKHQDWDRSEDKFRFYMPEQENDKLRRIEKQNAGVPTYVTIDVPYSYALMMTAHTYESSVFLGRNPVFQYSGRHGEAEDKVQSLEALINYQTQVGKHLVPFYIWLMDKLKYSVGIVGNYWEVEKIVASEYMDLPVKYFGVEIPGRTKRTKVNRTLNGYMGNRLFNIRPYDFRPDPRKPLHLFQSGEFCGRRMEMVWNDLQRGAEDRKYFNIDVLKKMESSGVKNRDQGSSANVNDLPEDTGTGGSALRSLAPWEGEEMVVELIPSEWKLGKGTYPEKWAFKWINDRVIIQARPLGCLHNQFPYSLMLNEIDGYNLHTRGFLEIAQPLNDTMSWLVNTHFYNVRKTLNDMFIVDPSMVVMKDMTDPGAGKLIRKTPAAYGKDIRHAIQQFPVVDVTRSHINDMQVISRLMQQVLGVAENLTGSVNSGGRKTATEVRTAGTGSINRMKTSTEYDSALGFAHLSQMLVQNTQQYYDMEQTFKIAGDIMGAEKHRLITPDDIAGFYDYIPVDGTLPLDRFAMANLFKEIMKDMVPMGLAQEYDMSKMFAYAMQTAGIKNINQFKVNVRPDGDIAADAAAGNIAPMGGARGAGPRQITGRTVSEQEGAGEPGRVPGMGASG